MITAQLETQKELAALMPAVLDRAFRGELWGCQREIRAVPDASA